MKTRSMRRSVILTLIIISVLMTSTCTEPVGNGGNRMVPTDNGNGMGPIDNGGNGNGGDPIVYSGVDDWTISPGYQNDAEPSDLRVSVGGASNFPARAGSYDQGFRPGTDQGQGALQVTWESSRLWRSCELHAALPAADYSSYDGVRFDIALPASINMLLVVRQGREAFRSGTDHFSIYRGSNDRSAYNWVTVMRPFSGVTIPGWDGFTGDGSTSTHAEQFTAWLSAKAALPLQLNLNPTLNSGTQMIDTSYTMYIDNIGFYKEGENDLILYNFEPESE